LNADSSDQAVVLLCVAAAVAFALLAWSHARLGARRRRALLERKLSADERERLEKAAPLCRRIPEPLRARWEGTVRLFLEEKTFVGCMGLSVDDDLRLVVAGQACLLLAGREDLDVFTDLSTVYMHPTTYVRRDEWSLDGGATVSEESVEFDGESWDRGAVVLSARAVRQSSRRPDGFNVVLHEFAHQFDALDGVSDGCPPMARELRGEWASVMAAEYEALRRADRKGKDTLLDPYGAESPAEFFAVAVETFFELPLDLREEHPRIHALLAGVFGTDPARW
jgi:MtfA peptidase